MQGQEREKKKMKIRGITLVALVVTIVVLIILATISINIIFGEEGILEKARQAKDMQANAQEEEKQILAETANSMEQHVTGERETVTIDKAEYEQMKADIAYLKEEIKLLHYPVLYENDEGWNSGSITVEGIEEYEEIGVYISVYNTDQIENSVLARCTRMPSGNFVGGSVRIEETFLNLSGLRIEVNGGDMLTYATGGKIVANSQETTLVRDTTKIYKIVGLTKKSQIVE